MNYSQVLDARRQAQETITNADCVARHAASLIKGRLRIADCYVDDLRELKRELQDFNANTGKWKAKATP